MKNNTTDTNWDELRTRIDKAKASMRKRKSLTGLKISEILHNRAEAIAKASETEEDTSKHISIIEFSLGQEKYAIETQYLKEVTGSNQIFEIPCTPYYIYGVINLRGKIITVIDLKKYLQLNYKGISDSSSIVIVEYKNSQVGLVADSIEGIHDISIEEIQNSKPKLKNIKDTFLQGITQDTVIVLDIVKLLEDEEILVNESII